MSRLRKNGKQLIGPKRNLDIERSMEMTREEAIAVLDMVEAHGSLVVEAKDMAIKALEQDGYYKDLAQSYERTIAKLTEAIAKQHSEDCVSRQAVLAGINDWWGITLTAGEPTICDYVRELPPVTPTRKKGKWIEEPNCWLRCSCCNSHHPHTSIYAIRGSNYCPECGAEMESEE